MKTVMFPLLAAGALIAFPARSLADPVPQYVDPASLGLTVRVTIPAVASLNGPIPVTKYVKNVSGERIDLETLNGRLPFVWIDPAGEHHLCVPHNVGTPTRLVYIMPADREFTQNADLVQLCHFEKPGTYLIGVEGYVRLPHLRGGTALSPLHTLIVTP